jgi:hypothetical protein
METIILGLLRLFCPYLKKMAEKTGSPIDDMIVGILCRAVEHDKQSHDT